MAPQWGPVVAPGDAPGSAGRNPEEHSARPQRGAAGILVESMA